MMEFFLSKIWAFVVAIVLLGVLLQGVDMQAQAEKASALQDLAGNVQEMFGSVKRAGSGMERTVDMGGILPLSFNLTIYEGHATLHGDGGTHTFPIPVQLLLIVTLAGEMQQAVSVSLTYENVIRLTSGNEGLTMFVLSPRNCPPGT